VGLATFIADRENDGGLPSQRNNCKPGQGLPEPRPAITVLFPTRAVAPSPATRLCLRAPCQSFQSPGHGRLQPTKKWPEHLVASNGRQGGALAELMAKSLIFSEVKKYGSGTRVIRSCWVHVPLFILVSNNCIRSRNNHGFFQQLV